MKERQEALLEVCSIRHINTFAKSLRIQLFYIKFSNNQMKNNGYLQEEKIKLEQVEMDRKANEDKLKVVFICEY